MKQGGQKHLDLGGCILVLEEADSSRSSAHPKHPARRKMEAAWSR